MWILMESVGVLGDVVFIPKQGRFSGGFSGGGLPYVNDTSR